MEENKLNIDKAMETLGYNYIKQSVKEYTSSNLGKERSLTRLDQDQQFS